MKWISFPDPALRVYGLPWFNETSPLLHRFPSRMKKKVRPVLWECSTYPAGGRIRFSSDSLNLGIMAESPSLSMHHMPRTGHSGFDLYVNNSFIFCAWPDTTGTIKTEKNIATEKKMRSIEIYLPLYNQTRLNAIAIDNDASIAPAPPFCIQDPVVFYGSSITQGGCASNPGTSWQGFLSRELHIDFVNLGFSGQGWGDPEIAEAIAELKASCIVLDHWANIRHNPLGYSGTIQPFVAILRKSMPTIPIILTGPYFYPSDSFDPYHDHLRKEIKRSAQTFKDHGDNNIHFFDNRKAIGKNQAFATVDGCHSTSLGFFLMAKSFAPTLRSILFKK
ncbi:MAG: SGNH/GDSL hydrolase family protein [Candidatus Ratteibacteria bacterium]